MSGGLQELFRESEGEKVQELRRPVTLVEERPDAQHPDGGLPALRFWVKYVPADVCQGLVKGRKTRGAGDESTYNLAEEVNYRRKVMAKAVDGWDGMIKQNLRSISSLALSHPQRVDKVFGEEKELAFSQAAVEQMATLIEFEHWVDLYHGITSHAGFADRIIGGEKNA